MTDILRSACVSAFLSLIELNSVYGTNEFPFNRSSSYLASETGSKFIYCFCFFLPPYYVLPNMNNKKIFPFRMYKKKNTHTTHNKRATKRKYKNYNKKRQESNNNNGNILDYTTITHPTSKAIDNFVSFFFFCCFYGVEIATCPTFYGAIILCPLFSVF